MTVPPIRDGVRAVEISRRSSSCKCRIAILVVDAPSSNFTADKDLRRTKTLWEEKFGDVRKGENGRGKRYVAMSFASRPSDISMHLPGY